MSEVQQSAGSIRIFECVYVRILCTQSSARSRNSDNLSVSVAADGSYGDVGVSVTHRWQLHYCLHANYYSRLNNLTGSKQFVRDVFSTTSVSV